MKSETQKSESRHILSFFCLSTFQRKKIEVIGFSVFTLEKILSFTPKKKSSGKIWKAKWSKTKLTNQKIQDKRY
jgi:hypothetical protein